MVVRMSAAREMIELVVDLAESALVWSFGASPPFSSGSDARYNLLHSFGSDQEPSEPDRRPATVLVQSGGTPAALVGERVLDAVRPVTLTPHALWWVRGPLMPHRQGHKPGGACNPPRVGRGQHDEYGHRVHAGGEEVQREQARVVDERLVAKPIGRPVSQASWA